MKELIPDTNIRNWVGPFSDKEFYYELGKKQAELVINELNVLPDSTILDVGCGCGRIAIHFLDYLQNGSYLGIDNNHELIQFCIDAIHQKFENFRFKEIDVYNKAYANTKTILSTNYKFEIQSDSIDQLICWSVFTHMQLKDCISYIREFSKVLKVGGTGIISFNLRNKEIDEQIDSGKTKVPIIHYYDQYSRIMNINQPEDCFAHSEEIIVKEILNTGMQIKKIVYGNWSKEHNNGEFHDIIIIEKVNFHITMASTCATKKVPTNI